MGIDFYSCDVCNESRHHDNIICDLYESCCCGSNVKLTDEEKALFKSLKWCEHTVCIDCLKFTFNFSDASVLDEYFREVVEKVRENKEYLQKFQDEILCSKCNEEDKTNNFQEHFKELIKTFDKMKKADIKAKLIELQREYKNI